MALTEKGIRVIEETIVSNWEWTPAQRTAHELWLLDISSDQLWEFRKTIRGSKIDEVWYQGTLNELRDLEAKGAKR